MITLRSDVTIAKAAERRLISSSTILDGGAVNRAYDEPERRGTRVHQSSPASAQWRWDAEP